MLRDLLGRCDDSATKPWSDSSWSTIRNWDKNCYHDRAEKITEALRRMHGGLEE